MSNQDYWFKRAQEQARQQRPMPTYTPPNPSWQERQTSDWGFKQAQQQINNSHRNNSGKK